MVTLAPKIHTYKKTSNPTRFHPLVPRIDKIEHCYSPTVDPYGHNLANPLARHVDRLGGYVSGVGGNQVGSYWHSSRHLRDYGDYKAWQLTNNKLSAMVTYLNPSISFLGYNDNPYNFSYSIWFSPDQLGITHYVAGLAVTNLNKRYFHIGVQSDNEIVLAWSNNDNYNEIATGVTAEIGRWYHGVAVWNTRRLRTFYLDGQKFTSTVTSNPSQTRNQFWLGRVFWRDTYNGTYNTAWWRGQATDLCIWRYNLTDTEAEQMYRIGPNMHRFERSYLRKQIETPYHTMGSPVEQSAISQSLSRIESGAVRSLHAIEHGGI